MHNHKENQEEIKPVKLNVKLLRGFKDTLPEDEDIWDFVFSNVVKVARASNFSFINTPVLEESGLFERTSGETSDIVSKELFRFKLPRRDKEDSGLEVALRPEGTAAVMRAYMEHGMLSKPQPVKLWYFESMFRYDKPQAGRYRQHTQWGFEVIGDSHPVLDAQVIIAMYQIYKAVGLDVVVSVNSLGDKNTRDAYTKALVKYFEPKLAELCTHCKKRIETNPMRILDCKDEGCQKIVSDSPQIVDFLDDDSRNHFVSVLEYLDELDIPYALDSRLVRGLDYYTHTTFEFFDKKDHENGSKLNALGGGGRYDGLAESIDGRPTPAVGAAAGVERLIVALRKNDIKVPTKKKMDVFVAQLGKEARLKCLGLIEELRENGWSVGENLSKDGLSTQLERANKSDVQFTLILGQKEILEDTIIIRDMSSGIQEDVVFDKIVSELEKRVKKVAVVTQNGNGNLQNTADQVEPSIKKKKPETEVLVEENNLNDIESGDTQMSIGKTDNDHEDDLGKEVE